MGFPKCVKPSFHQCSATENGFTALNITCIPLVLPSPLLPPDQFTFSVVLSKLFRLTSYTQRYAFKDCSMSFRGLRAYFFPHWVLLSCMDLPAFACPFIYWSSALLLPGVDSYEWSCCRHWCAGLFCRYNLSPNLSKYQGTWERDHMVIMCLVFYGWCYFIPPIHKIRLISAP